MCATGRQDVKKILIPKAAAAERVAVKRHDRVFQLIITAALTKFWHMNLSATRYFMHSIDQKNGYYCLKNTTSYYHFRLINLDQN